LGFKLYIITYYQALHTKGYRLNNINEIHGILKNYLQKLYLAAPKFQALLTGSPPEARGDDRFEGLEL